MSLGGDRHECVREGSVPESCERVLSEVSVSPGLSGAVLPSSVDPGAAGVAVLGVEAKRRRVDADEDYLESEDDVPASDLEEFACRMDSLQIERGSAEWRSYWKTHAELRLKFNNPAGFAEYERRQGARERGDGPDDERRQGARERGDGPDEEEDADEFDDSVFMDLEDGGEEARVMKMSRPVTRPSPETVRQHNVSHCQYRSWCPICVAGAADDRNHEMRQVVEGTCPEVGSDYGFMRNRRKDKFYKPLLVSKYRTIGAFAAHMVPRKGVGGGWIVQQYLRDLKNGA